jgi:hypothetical protein
MQHKPNTGLHRSTLWRRKNKTAKAASSRGRKPVDLDLENRQLSLAAGIIDRLREHGCCPLHKLTAPSPECHLPAVPLAGSQATIDGLIDLDLSAKNVLFFVAAYLCDALGELRIAQGDRIAQGRQIGENLADAMYRLDEEDAMKFCAVRDGLTQFNGRTRKTAVSAVTEFRELGLDRKSCWHIKNRKNAKDEFRLILRFIGELPDAPDRPVDRAVYALPRIGRLMNKQVKQT